MSLNCATLDAEDFDRELFGEEQGGTNGLKFGLLERANGGTLLLDEVADMPLATQGKFVRVLQESAFTRVGGRNSVKVDVRILSASNRDLAKEIPEGPSVKICSIACLWCPFLCPALKTAAQI